MPGHLTDERLLAFARTLMLDSTLADVVRALREREVQCLLLKGPALAHLLSSEDHRSYNDIDLMVAPRSRAAAEQTLRELGFRGLCERWRASERCSHAEPWRHRVPPHATIDLHRTLFLVRAEPARVWDALARDAEVLEVSGEAVSVPSRAARALIVALHAAHHGPRQPHPLADLDRAVRMLDIAVWHEALALAHELGAIDGLAGGLRMCDRGAHVADTLGLGAPLYVRLRAHPAATSWRGFERLASQRSLRARAVLIVNELWPSPGALRAYYPELTRRSGGLAMAHALRPLSLLLHARRGWRAWRSEIRPRPAARGS